jgi:hypothetical protein
METSFNVLSSHRFTQHNKQWSDGVAVCSKSPTAKRFSSRVVNENGSSVLHAFTNSIPSENDVNTASGMLIQTSPQLIGIKSEPRILPVKRIRPKPLSSPKIIPRALKTRSTFRSIYVLYPST